MRSIIYLSVYDLKRSTHPSGLKEIMSMTRDQQTPKKRTLCVQLPELVFRRLRHLAVGNDLTNSQVVIRAVETLCLGSENGTEKGVES
jgi:hypothetical protein